jgi:sugar phosphate isomerase/epimerase
VLADHGVRLGLEYVAPRTCWAPRRYPFIHSLAQMADLCRSLGANVGFLLDSWHWHCAGEGTAALAPLAGEQVIDVHVNDAPAGTPTEALIDSVRALPGETGVIDIAGFLSTLHRIG